MFRPGLLGGRLGCPSAAASSAGFGRYGSLFPGFPASTASASAASASATGGSASATAAATALFTGTSSRSSRATPAVTASSDGRPSDGRPGPTAGGGAKLDDEEEVGADQARNQAWYDHHVEGIEPGKGGGAEVGAGSQEVRQVEPTTGPEAVMLLATMVAQKRPLVEGQQVAGQTP